MVLYFFVNFFRSKLSPNHDLELEFKAHGDKWDRETVAKYCDQLKVTERDIQVWIRYQKALSKPSKLDKFAETGWRWVFYTSIFTFSLVTLSKKTWFWNILDCWLDFPHHQMDNDVWWMYMLELSFYWGLFFTQVRYSNPLTLLVKSINFWIYEKSMLATNNQGLYQLFLTVN